MKQTFKCCSYAAIAVLIFISCKKSTDTQVADDPLLAVKKIIRAQGFDVSDLIKVDGGYLVEGDIFYSEANLHTGPDNKMLPGEEQYRVNSLVTLPPAPGTRTITIRLAANLNTAFWNTALQTAVNRFNATGIRLRFSKVATGAAANMTVTGIAGTGVSSGFPSGGNPYNAIQIGTGFVNCGPGTAASIITHLIGHSIGFRHTDWFVMVLPCRTVIESGAIHIPGTPVTAVPGSWMNTCYVCGADTPFVPSDITALRVLYQ
jgi:Dual-action HEIGH metallo-peptidase